MSYVSCSTNKGGGYRNVNTLLTYCGVTIGYWSDPRNEEPNMYFVQIAVDYSNVHPNRDVMLPENGGTGQEWLQITWEQYDSFSRWGIHEE